MRITIQLYYCHPYTSLRQSELRYHDCLPYLQMNLLSNYITTFYMTTADHSIIELQITIQ